MHDSVCIVGIGALTSVGLNAAATAAAVRAGIAGFEEHPYMINQEGDPFVVAMVPSIDDSAMGTQRYVELTIPAIKEALTPLHNLTSPVGPIPVVIGLPEVRPGMPDDLSSVLTDKIRQLNTSQVYLGNVQTLSKGHSAGLMAIDNGSNLLFQNASKFCLIGGIDSYVERETLAWIEANEQLHKPSNAWGFIPGEASAFCLICSKETADKYSLTIKAQLLAISTAIENNKIKTESVCIGEGLTQAVRNTFQALPNEFRIDNTICDLNGEAFRSDEFGFMLARLTEFFIDPSDYIAPADCWGDVGAASGPLFINLIAAAADRGYSKGPHTLLWTSSEGGERTAALFLTGNREKK
jgi:3-oxoacyl-[acyl-carrier-protein] synthase-1